MEKKKKPKKFKPFTVCRFLPGEVADCINLVDLFQFNCHRFRVFQAKPTIDAGPDKLNPYKIMPTRKMEEALFKAYQIDKENKLLLNKINKIHRTGGVIDSFNARAYEKLHRRWHRHEEDMRAVVNLNKYVYIMIKDARSHYPKKELDKQWKETEKRIRNSCRYELVIGKEFDYDLMLRKEPSISQGLDIEIPEEEQVTRPLCYLAFRVEGGPYLGKVIIELYEDVVPVTCQNFLEICKGEGELTYQGCLLHRIVKGKFIETGDITHNTGRGGMSIYGKTFPEENHILKHTKAGVLSMKRIPPLSENNSQFIITLTQMDKWDKMHVVFGRIIKGSNVLFKIQDYGRRIGKPYANVYICNCGVIEVD